MAISTADAYDLIIAPLQTEIGRFYGATEALDFGAGLIFSGVKYPQYNDENGLFATLRGLVYVLTHECDVAQENERPFNDDVAIIPVIPFDIFVQHYVNSVFEHGDASSFLGHIANKNVNRIHYLPTFPTCPHGGILFLNQITSTKLQCFEENEAKRVAAVSEYGRRSIDYSFENNFLRPTQDMPLRRGMEH